MRRKPDSSDIKAVCHQLVAAGLAFHKNPAEYAAIQSAETIADGKAALDRTKSCAFVCRRGFP